MIRFKHSPKSGIELVGSSWCVMWVGFISWLLLKLLDTFNGRGGGGGGGLIIWPGADDGGEHVEDETICAVVALIETAGGGAIGNRKSPFECIGRWITG